MGQHTQVVQGFLQAKGSQEYRSHAGDFGHDI